MCCRVTNQYAASPTPGLSHVMLRHPSRLLFSHPINSQACCASTLSSLDHKFVTASSSLSSALAFDMTYGRDSDDLFEWHRPTSIGEGVRLIYYNFFCGIGVGLLWIGFAFYQAIFKCMLIRTACGNRTPHYIKERREAIIEARRRGKLSVVPLPAVRKRALTVPSSLDSTSHLGTRHRTDAQEACGLLSKLPFEIRRLVFEYAIFHEPGRNLVHIYKQNRKMGHWQCHNSQPLGTRGAHCVQPPTITRLISERKDAPGMIIHLTSNRPSFISQQTGNLIPYPNPRSMLLPLAKACRQM